MNLINIIRALATLSWLGVIGAVAFTVARAARGQRARGGGVLVAIAVVLALVLNAAAAGLNFVQPNERGVVITAASGGIRPAALDPGLRWVIPFYENVVVYDVSRQTYTMSIASSEGQIAGDDSVQSRTSDGQVVFVDSSVIFAVNPATIVELHKQWQNTYIDGLIRPLARGIIRDAVSVYGIEEVYSIKRIDLTVDISDELEAKLAAEGIILIDFVLRNIAFSPEYAASVEQKQIAEQQAQQAVFVVQQREEEANQARAVAAGQADASVIRAEGDALAVVIAATAAADARLLQATAEATALIMLGEAISANPDILTLEYIQKLSPNIQIMLLPSDNPLLLPIPELPAATTPPVVVP